MNQKALDLGLTNTHFETPHGLDSDGHYTTAYELALLSNYALKNKTFAHLYDICVGKVTTLNNDEQALENKIKQKEIVRLSEIAENAINVTEATRIIMSLND